MANDAAVHRWRRSADKVGVAGCETRVRVALSASVDPCELSAKSVSVTLNKQSQTFHFVFPLS